MLLTCESGGTRTHDTKLKRLLLYRLSYGPLLKIQNLSRDQRYYISDPTFLQNKKGAGMKDAVHIKK